MSADEHLADLPLSSMSSWVIRPARNRRCPLELTSFAPDLTGPHAASFVAKARINESAVDVTYTLQAGQRKLDIDIKAEWLERGGPEFGTPALRMQFPFALKGAVGRYEIPYGSIQRDTRHGEEVPALRWVDVTGRVPPADAPGGCAVLNDCKYGFSLDESTLRVTLIRSSYDPDPLPEMGEHTIRLALAPHDARLPPAELFKLGAAFNHPLQVVSTDSHRGTFPSVGNAVVATDNDNVLMTAIKKAENEPAVILRLLETNGQAATANVVLDPRMMGKPADVVEVDVIERPLANSTAKATAQGLTIDLPAHGLVSVKITFAQ